MQNNFYKICMLFLLGTALLNTQCKNKEYDLSEGINRDIEVGGDSLMFPVGSTDTLRLSMFLNTDDISMLSILEDGSYALLMADSVDVEVPELNPSDLSIEDVAIENSEAVPLFIDTDYELIAPKTKALAGIALSVEINDSNTIDVKKNNFPESIYSLDTLGLVNGKLEISIDMKNAPDLGNPFRTNLRIDLPDNIRFGNSVPLLPGNILELKRDFVDGKLSLVLDVLSFVLDGQPLNGTFDFLADVKYKGKIGVVPTEGTDLNQFVGKVMDITIAAKLKNLEFNSIVGILDPKIPLQNIAISLASLPAFLKGDNVVLDFANPHLDLIARSNLGIPIDAEININPWLNGSINSSGVQDFAIAIPSTPSPSQMGLSKYWIADNSDGMPVGYTLKQTPLSDLLKKVPDSIQFAINAQADKKQKHRIELGASYKTKLNYKFIVPISFGSEFILSLSDTIANLPSMVGGALQGSTFAIYGDVINTLPIDLELKLLPLDSAFNIIPVDTKTQIIKAGTRAGAEVSTNLNIEITDPNLLMKNVYGFILQFGAKTGADTEGVTIKENSYVRARLKLRLIGGINITL